MTAKKIRMFKCEAIPSLAVRSIPAHSIHAMTRNAPPYSRKMMISWTSETLMTASRVRALLRHEPQE